MTFTFMDLVIIGGFCLTVLALVGSLVAFLSKQIHGRITEVKRDLEKEITDIRDTYAHKDSISVVMNQMMLAVEDIKKEQQRMAQRMDDFAKWVTELVISREKK